MFFYFPIKHKNGTVVGRVCVQNGRATFSLSRPIDAEATLFADGRQLPLRPGDSAPAAVPEGLLGTKDGALVYGGVAPGSGVTTSELLYRLSQNNPNHVKCEPMTAQKAEEIPSVEPPAAPDSVPDRQTAEPVSAPQIQDTDKSGAKMSHDKKSGDSVPTFADFAENPIVYRAKSVFSRLEARHPMPATETISIPISGQTVDNPVDTVDNTEDFSVQNRDISACSPSDRTGFSSAAKTDVAYEDAVPYDVAAPLLHVRHEQTAPIRLFPAIFPGAVWRAVQDGDRTRFEGLWQHRGERVRILAVRGAYTPEPPKGLSGYTRYLKQDGVGYWVRLLPMGRSPEP